MLPLSALAALFLAGPALSRDVPENLKHFYDGVRERRQCGHKLATGFWSSDEDNTFAYCGDQLDDQGIVYIQGTKGALANMDIDCDGRQGGPADDGRCGASTDTQSQTTFRETVESYDKGIKDLDAKVHPYVVFGNQGRRRRWRTFDPEDYGIEPLSVMAVVCGDRLVYGVWGDTNGDDGEHPMVGEASISLATACYGKGITGNAGHDEDDVLYIAFVGEDAVPGADGANWSATNFEGFERSIEERGDMLVERINTDDGDYEEDDASGGLLWTRYLVLPVAASLIVIL